MTMENTTDAAIAELESNDRVTIIDCGFFEAVAEVDAPDDPMAADPVKIWAYENREEFLVDTLVHSDETIKAYSIQRRNN